MKYMAIAWQLGRQVQVPAIFEARCVPRRPLASLVVVFIDVLEFGAQNAGVEIIQAAIETEAVDVAGVRAVVAQLAHFGVNIGIVRYERAAVTERAEIFLDDEARRRGIA